ncbi:hypothetical protein H257_12145 [Aphanomyces astaci]|uniref:Uncharacterized protein n=1 Tax=Aphanomyces astaci TaxID=112090 RepID=W4FZ76_APHAT|nr:hypothetical protein H257_12145 [Aphanomyces astaci]ETV72777.1 hypothetical protein H257_12145 [Aphanomyces astaci]|eukprot:XP_009837563.1 hypothetical protein H257_12145 [Aphanomyces astaci]
MASESVVGRSDDDDREVAKWKRRLDENKYIRANLLDQANMLSYTMQRLSARHRGLGVVDVYSIWRMLGQGYSIDERDDNGVPPLVHCAIRGWLGVILMFSQHPHNVNVTSTMQETAVSAACRRGHMNVVRYLIRRDADLSVCDKSGFSCLRWAAKHRNKHLVRLLLQRGVSVQKDCGTVNHSALDWARANHDEDIENMLVAVLVEEKKVQVAILQQKAKATHEKSAASAAKVVAEATAVVAEPTMEERRQEHLKHQEQERDAAFRERVDALYSQQPVQLLKSLRPIEVAPLPVPVAETEWRKKECMAWERVAVSPKRQEEATPHVNMTRIRQLMTMDDDVEDASMDALVSFAQRAKPKPASLKFYCPEV